MQYVLDEHLRPVREPDTLRWARGFERRNRRVAETLLPGYWISTVFLGIDHRFWGKGPPIVFETMVFKRVPPEQISPNLFDREIRVDAEGLAIDYTELDMDRYSTWDEAMEGHCVMVARYTVGRMLGPIGG